VTFWTAGFDVIYSCQDYEFDIAEGLFSVPRVLGIAGALRAARAMHAMMVVCLLALVWGLHLGGLRWPASPPSWRCWFTSTA